MEEKKLVPKLRFPGFTEPWEQRKFKSLFQKNLERNDGQFPFNKTISISRMIYSESGNGANTESLDNYKVLRVGDIAFEGHENKDFKFGRFVMNDVGNGIMSPRFTVLRPLIDMELNFWKEYINYEPIMQKKLVYSTKKGTMMNELVIEDFLNQYVAVPSIQEQQKIGYLLKCMTDDITLHQRKLEHLKLKKKSLLQKLFPKEGEVYPELRFPGFTDPWEQRKLDEVFQIIDGDRGKNYPGTGDFLSNGDVLFLDTGNVRKDGFNFDNKRYIDFNRDKLLRNGRLILGDYVLTSRGTLGNLAYYSQSIYNRYPHIRINSAMLILRMMNTIKVNNLYLYITLRSNVINEFMKHNFVGSAQPHITKKEFSSVLLPIPRQLEEQKIIGDFFDKLEKIITLHQRKLEHLQLLKKALLQQLFV